MRLTDCMLPHLQPLQTAAPRLRAAAGVPCWKSAPRGVTSFMHAREHLPHVVARIIGATPQSISIVERPLRGGLEGAAVTAFVARLVRPDGRPATLRIVAKHLSKALMREAAVYERLVARHVPSLAPRVLATVPDAGGAIVFMSAAQRRSAWPWRHITAAHAALAAVAQLHAAASAADDLPAWDYEAELERSARATLALAESARSSGIGPLLRESLPALRRLVADRPAWRDALLSGPLAPCVIHGDLHTGNVFAGSGSPPRITLLDWGRARLGSPLEDVSSWLQSLAFWEPMVRRRHDTLLNGYLAARGVAGPASPELRATYWLAGASNALGGALAFHVGVAASDDFPPQRRAPSTDAVRDGLRVIRRADACWCAHAWRPRPVAVLP